MTTGKIFSNQDLVVDGEESFIRLLQASNSGDDSDADKADSLLKKVFFVFHILDEISKLKLASDLNLKQQELVKKINEFFKEIAKLRNEGEKDYSKIRSVLSDAYRTARIKKTTEVAVDEETIKTILRLSQSIKKVCFEYFSKTYPAIQRQLEKDEKLLSRFMLAYIHYAYAYLRGEKFDYEIVNLAEVLSECVEKYDEKDIYQEDEERIKNEFFASIEKKIAVILQATGYNQKDRDAIIKKLDEKRNLPQNIEHAMLSKLKCIQLDNLYQIRLQKLKEIRDLPNQKAITKEIEEKIEANQKKMFEQDEVLINFISEFCKEYKIFNAELQFTDLPIGDIKRILQENEAARKISWREWIGTQVFATRISSTIGMLFGGSSLGIGAGFMLGGPMGAILGAAPAVFASATIATAAFFAPEIKQNIDSGREQFLEALQKIFITLESSFLKEFPLNGLAERYKPTQKMIDRFTSIGAQNIAKWYVNNLFKLQIAIRNSPSNKEFLKESYFYLLLNYQMLRGSKEQIEKIFENLSWGAELAQKQIDKMARLIESDLLSAAVKLVAYLELEKNNKQQSLFLDAAIKLDEISQKIKETDHSLEYEKSEKAKGKEEEKEEKSFSVSVYRPSRISEQSMIVAKMRNEENHYHSIVKSYQNISKAQQDRLNETKIIYEYSKEIPNDILGLQQKTIALDTDLSVKKLKELIRRKEYGIFQYYWVDEVILTKIEQEIKQNLSDKIEGESILQCLVKDLSEGGSQLDRLIFKLEEKGKMLPSYASLDDVQTALDLNNVAAVNAYLTALKRQYASILSEQDKAIARKMLEMIIQYQARHDEVVVCYELADRISNKKQEEAKRQEFWKVIWGEGSSASTEDIYFELLVSSLESPEDFISGDFVPQQYQDYLPSLRDEIQEILSRNKKREAVLETEEMQAFRKNIEKSVFLTEDQKKMFNAVFVGDYRFIENNLEIAIQMLYSNNVMVDGKNLFWLAIKLNDEKCLSALYQAVLPRSTVTSYLHAHPQSMIQAAPNKPAFLLAAQEEDKRCFRVLSQPVIIFGVPSRKPFSRFDKDEKGRTAFHYIAESGSPNDIVDFLNLQGLSLIGQQSKWNKNYFAELDNAGNSPMGLLLQREDALACIEAMYRFFRDRYKSQTSTGQEYCGTFFDLDQRENIDKALNDFSLVFEKKPELSNVIVSHTCAFIENGLAVNDLENTLRRCVIMSARPFNEGNFERSLELLLEKIQGKPIFDLFDISFFVDQSVVKEFLKRGRGNRECLAVILVNKVLHQIQQSPTMPEIRRAFFESLKFCCLMENETLLERILHQSKVLYQANEPSYYLSYMAGNPLDKEFEVFYEELSKLPLSSKIRTMVNEKLSATTIGAWRKIIDAQADLSPSSFSPSSKRK